MIFQYPQAWGRGKKISGSISNWLYVYVGQTPLRGFACTPDPEQGARIKNKRFLLHRNPCQPRVCTKGANPRLARIRACDALKLKLRPDLVRLDKSARGCDHTIQPDAWWIWLCFSSPKRKA